MTIAQVANDTDNLDLKQLLRTLAEVKKGNFSARMPLDHTGIGGKIADTLNDIIDMNERMAAELERVSNVVGKEGKINERATLGNAKGSWKAALLSVNTLVTDLVQPTAETARVIRAVANGDLSQAIAFLQKPISGEALSKALSDIKQFVERPVKNLLIIEDDDIQRNSIAELIGNTDVASTGVATGAAALAALKAGHFDCVVLDLGLPDMSGIELIEQIKEEPNLNHLPIVIYTGKDLTHHEETELQRISNTIIVKDVRSPERLLDETALFLHRVQANLPPDQQMMLEQVRHQDPVLAGQKVLIVDDDVRNIFALTSLLERYQMEIFYAENGRDGITLLENHPDINIVLMDVMMPGMDGYETMQAIRAIEQFQNIPMIALTAKAMKGDREKCIDAGASDYITKPVDTEQLLSLLRVWLYR